MPKIDYSSYIKGSAARYNKIKGNLLLSADGIWFVPDDGGSELYLPIEKIMDAHIEGVVLKKISVITNSSNDRYLFSVAEKDEWKSAISLAAGIYRRVTTGTSSHPVPPSNGQAKAQSKTQAVTVTPPQAPVSPQVSPKPQAQKKKRQPAAPKPSQAPTPPPSPAKSAPTPAATQAPTQTSPVAAPAQMAPGRSSTVAAYTGPWPSGQDYEQSFQVLKLSMNA